MRVTDFTKGILAYRKEVKAMAAKGYKKVDYDYRLMKLYGEYNEKFLDAKVGCNGTVIFYKTGT